jgi:pSer/pThr/pTyr-binding forkhead associated (FHA) protein
MLKFLIGSMDVGKGGFESVIKEGKTVIGRECKLEHGDDHILDLAEFDVNNLVSVRHATILKEDDKMLLQDEGSTNGTYLINPVDGSQTKVESNRKFPIRLGDTFVVGSIVIRIKN